MPSKRAKNRDSLTRKGRSENLNRGRKKGDRPARKLPEQKVTEFCLYYLTYGESIKAAGLHVGLADTYVYEFFQKPQVQKRLEELRLKLDEKLLQNAANQVICTRAFIDKHLAATIVDRRTPAKDRVAALRLAADIARLTEKSNPQVQQATFIAAQSIQAGPYLAQQFAKLKQDGEYRSEHLTLALPAAPPQSEVSKYD